MNSFFIKVGNFLSHKILEENLTNGHKIFTCLFIYEFGQATFNGKQWKFSLEQEES